MGGLSSGPATNALVLFSSTSLLSPRNHFRRVLVREPCLDWALCRGLLKGWAGWGQCWKPKGTGSHHLIGDFSKAFFFFFQKKACAFQLSFHSPLPRLPSPAMVSLDLFCILLRLLFWRRSLLQLSRGGFPPGRPDSGSSPLAESVPQRALPYFTWDIHHGKERQCALGRLPPQPDWVSTFSS